MKKAMLFLFILALLPAGVLAQDMPHAGAEIVATYMQSGTYDVGAENIEEAFEDATGIEVELVALPWAVLNQNHITDLTTGTGEFDVMSGEFWIASVWDKMLPLDEFVERDEYGGDFIPTIWQPGPSGHFDGKRIGIPYSADAYGIIYRTDIFEEAGIAADWETWDDYIAALDELAMHLEGTDIAPSVFAWGASEQTPAIFLGMYDGYLVNADGNYALDEDSAIAALNQMASLLAYNPEGATGLSIDEANSVFLTGKAATMICWVSFVRASAQNPDASLVVDNWATAPFPGPGFPFLSAWNLFISEYSENPDAAWEWVKSYINSEQATQRFVELGVGSPYLSTYEDPDLMDAYSHDFPNMVHNLGRAQSVPWVFEAFEIFFRNTSELVIGSISAEEALANTLAGWAEVTVPPALVQSAAAQGQQQDM
ncbi:MAG: extracellular solute-binding protein [Chloroflexota bacterium]|nr:extracellular solute-binding protein [Chloroflexota bacterium]MDE2947234.1 extracellular solute-binding protein [Chloroflexota bacterium]